MAAVRTFRIPEDIITRTPGSIPSRGDLPPLLSMGGRAFLAVETGRFTPCEVVGRTVVIHGSADDFHTQPAGNAGKKIACGVIRRV